jgi:ATP synthase protein I
LHRWPRAERHSRKAVDDQGITLLYGRAHRLAAQTKYPRAESFLEATLADSEDRENQHEKEEGLSDLARGYRSADRYIGAVFTLVASVGILSWAGFKLDQKWGHRVPWLLLVGAAVGMIGGFVGFFRIVLGMDKEQRKDRK